MDCSNITGNIDVVVGRSHFREFTKSIGSIGIVGNT
jgi:hypothetical protein